MLATLWGLSDFEVETRRGERESGRDAPFKFRRHPATRLGRRATRPPPSRPCSPSRHKWQLLKSWRSETRKRRGARTPEETRRRAPSGEPVPGEKKPAWRLSGELKQEGTSGTKISSCRHTFYDSNNQVIRSDYGFMPVKNATKRDPRVHVAYLTTSSEGK